MLEIVNAFTNHKKNVYSVILFDFVEKEYLHVWVNIDDFKIKPQNGKISKQQRKAIEFIVKENKLKIALDKFNNFDAYGELNYDV